MFIIIGIFTIFTINDRSIPKTTYYNPGGSVLGIPEKIAIFVTIWTVLMFLITGSTDLETFFILIFIGLILVQELADEFTSAYLKNRMYVFISVFFIVFVVLISIRVISFISI
jgi:hypothetical protein